LPHASRRAIVSLSIRAMPGKILLSADEMVNCVTVPRGIANSGVGV